MIERLRRVALRWLGAPEPAESSDVTVLALRNGSLVAPPTTGDHPSVAAEKRVLRELFETAFHGERFPVSEDALVWVQQFAQDDHVLVLVARRGPRWRGLAIVTAWTDVFSPHPWVAHFHAPGDREIRLALAREIAAWVRQQGYERFSALNRSHLPDDVFLAAFSKALRGRRVAGYLEFEVPP